MVSARISSAASVLWYRGINRCKISSVGNGGAEYLEALVSTARSAMSGETDTAKRRD